MSKGSKRRPSGLALAERDEKYEACFGPKKDNLDLSEVGHVRYKAHPDTGDMIPDYMWDQLGMAPRPVPRTAAIWRDHPSYQSPIDNKTINGRRQRRYDFDRTGSRAFEGFESERRAADAHLQHEDRKLEEAIDRSMPETLNDIKHSNNPPPQMDKNGKAKISYTF